MSTTLRLYSELTSIDLHRKVLDSSFERERRDIMHEIGLNNHTSFKRTKPLKYHGKMARNKSIQSIDLVQDARKKKKIQDSLRKANNITSVIQKFQKELETGLPLPDKFYRELQKEHNSNHTTSNCNQIGSNHLFRNKSSSSPIKSTVTNISTFLPRILSSSSSSSVVACAVRMQPIYKDTLLNRVSPLKTVPHISKAMWHSDEIVQFNEVYHSIPKPKFDDKEHVKLYFDSISKRHQYKYPHRSRSEIIRKIQEFQRANRLHTVNENEYWKSKYQARIKKPTSSSFFSSSSS